MANVVSMPRYDKYKDSGIDWIGNVPKGWVLTRLGSRFIERKKKVSDVDYSALSVTKNGILPQLESAAKTKNGDQRKLVKKGDFVINSRSDRKGSSGISPKDGSVSLINIVLEPKGIFPEYCQYLLKSYSFIEEYYRVGRGIVADLWSTRYEEMRTITIAIPSYEEQILIVEFLRQKTDQLNQAIAIKEKQIKQLKERKQIIIQKAVTQGLNTDVKMRDSGVDWIGKIPKHWKVIKLKRLANKIVDGAHFTPTYVDSGIPFLRVTDLSNMKSGLINWQNVRYIPEKEHKELIKRVKAEKGDVLLSKNGTIGLTKVIDWDQEFSFFVSLCLLKLKPIISPHYFTSFFNSPIVDLQIAYGSSRTSITNLHLEKIKELMIIFPPIEEQANIDLFIRHITSEHDQAIEIQQSQIKKLKEYKMTLIDSVVTGKIKVTPETITQ